MSCVIHAIKEDVIQSTIISYFSDINQHTSKRLKIFRSVLIKKKIMKYGVVILLLCAALKSQAQMATENMHTCMIHDLKQKGLLEEDFPFPGSPTGCFLLSTFLSITEDLITNQFDKHESINADCVKPKFRQYKLYDYLMMNEVVEKSKQISKEKADELMKVARKEIKDVIDKAAEDCNSDPTWAGLMDNVLGIKNTTLIVLQQDYCFLKNSIDKKLINVGEVKMNPENIDIHNLNCDEFIQNHMNEVIRNLRKVFEEKALRTDQIDVLINILKTGNFFDVQIAIVVIEKLDISLELLRENKQGLARILEEINHLPDFA